MSDYRLGKKVTPIPTPDVIEDKYEKVNAHGTILRNKRTGKLETSITPKGPQYAPPVYTPEQWDAMIRGLLQDQEDCGFPLNEFGVL